MVKKITLIFCGTDNIFFCKKMRFLFENGFSRPSSILTSNCGFICEHLHFVQYKTKTKKVCGFQAKPNSYIDE